MHAGYHEEAARWRDWLVRSVAGSPDQLQVVYGVAGERHLLEWEVPWLPGHCGAWPVRVGNAAIQQLQLDIFGVLGAVPHPAPSLDEDNPLAHFDRHLNLFDSLKKTLP